MAPPLAESLRNQILGMLKAKCSVAKIQTTLGCHRSTVFRIKKRAEERNNDLSTKTGSGRKAKTVNKGLIDKVQKRIVRDPTKSGRALARECGVALSSMQVAIHKAGFRSMSRLVMHDIMPGQQERRLERAIKLLQWRTKNPTKIIIWTDEKLFLVQQHLNKRNNRIFLPLIAADHTLRIVRKKKNPAKVMVFAAVASDGKSMDPIIFPRNMTVNSTNYQQVVLTKLAKWIRDTWAPGTTVLMQNGAPAHTSASTQSWLSHNLGPNSFWDKSMWPPSSPDCNPCDFSIWTMLVSAVCKTEPKNREDLVKRINSMWAGILDPCYLVKTCAAAWDRLRAVVDAKGDYSESVKRNKDFEDEEVMEIEEEDLQDDVNKVQKLDDLEDLQVNVEGLLANVEDEVDVQKMELDQEDMLKMGEDEKDVSMLKEGLSKLDKDEENLEEGAQQLEEVVLQGEDIQQLEEVVLQGEDIQQLEEVMLHWEVVLQVEEVLKVDKDEEDVLKVDKDEEDVLKVDMDKKNVLKAD